MNYNNLLSAYQLDEITLPVQLTRDDCIYKY